MDKCILFESGEKYAQIQHCVNVRRQQFTFTLLVDYCDVLSAILTAPIHHRGSIGEQVMLYKISLNLLQWRNKLILDNLKVSKLSERFHFWVNGSFMHIALWDTIFHACILWLYTAKSVIPVFHACIKCTYYRKLKSQHIYDAQKCCLSRFSWNADAWTLIVCVFYVCVSQAHISEDPISDDKDTRTPKNTQQTWKVEVMIRPQR